MFDIKKAEADARAELAKEQAEAAKGTIKAHLKKLASARAIVTNLEREFEVMLAEVGSDGE